MSRRVARLAVGGAVVGVVAATGAVVATVVDRREADVRSPLAAAFDERGMVRVRARAALLSPTGRAMVVVTDGGVGLAGAGAVHGITPRRSNAVDAGWFPNEAAVLVSEGPLSTGQLAVVELDGDVRGSIPLEPSFAVGSGHGLDVAPSGRRAVATAEVRETIGGARHLHLVAIDLETGSVRELTAPSGSDELRPFHLDDGRVAYSSTNADGTSLVMVIDLATGQSVAASPPGERARAVGVVGDQPAYVVGRTVWVGGPEERRRLGRFDGDVVAVHPEGRGVVTRTRAGHLRWHEL